MVWLERLLIFGGAASIVIAYILLFLYWGGYRSTNEVLAHSFGGSLGVWPTGSFLPRLAGTTAEPQQFSVAFLTALMLMLSRRYVRFFWPVALAGLLALLLSQSKFALISLVAVALYLDAIYKQHRLIFGALLALLIPAGLMFVSTLPVFETTLRQGFEAQAFTDRLENLGIMGTIIRDEPLDGIGVGQYGTYRGELLFNNPFENPNYTAGNDIVSIFAETGVFGFALVTLLFGVLFSKFVAALPRLTRAEKERYLPFLIGALTILLNMFIGYEFLHVFFWINLGVLLYLYRVYGFEKPGGGSGVTLFVNARFLTQDVVGVQRYAIEICKRLKVLRPDARFLTPRGVKYPELAEQLGAEVVGRLTGHAWEQGELLARTRGGALLSLCNTGPVAHPRQVVTLHDASPFAVPEAYSRAFRSWYRVLFTGFGRTARVILTSSHFSKLELMRHMKISEHKLKVVYLGREHVLEVRSDLGILDKHALHQRPFLLAVGSSSPHKNFGALVRALEKLGETTFRVIIAGGSNPKVHAAAGTLPESVTHVGYVSDGELRALYEHAAGFVHPAYYEGFGIPPLEAMTLGCPVVVSNAASLPEVCGDAALYFDPFNEDDIADKIQMFMQDEGLQTRLRTLGAAQAERFSWDKAAREVLEFTEHALEF